jgi:hypothetical protein
VVPYVLVHDFVPVLQKLNRNFIDRWSIKQQYMGSDDSSTSSSDSDDPYQGLYKSMYAVCLICEKPIWAPEDCLNQPNDVHIHRRCKHLMVKKHNIYAQFWDKKNKKCHTCKEPILVCDCGLQCENCVGHKFDTIKSNYCVLCGTYLDRSHWCVPIKRFPNVSFIYKKHRRHIITKRQIAKLIHIH